MALGFADGTSKRTTAWAIERWSENAQVSLADELPYLKAENRLAQDRVRNPLLPPHPGQIGDASEEQP